MGRFAPLDDDDPRAVAGYALRARLGGGGMGQVYLSYTPGRRAVAVKVVRRELADDPEFRRRFRREVEVAQRVQGLYTAPVLDTDPDAPRPWLATAYVAGPTLQEAVAEHGPLPTPVVARILAGCAEALASVHAAGLVHRDFKPGNVLLADDGPKVIDFGIARAADASTLTRSGVLVGTPAFMAPEQITGGEITSAADVFALGLTAFYAATGTSAFGEGDPRAVMYRITSQPPDLERCPPELRDLLGRCLERDAVSRPGTTEIIEAAGALVPDEPETSESVEATDEPDRPGDGHWLPSGIATTMPRYRPPARLQPAPQPVPPGAGRPHPYARPPTWPMPPARTLPLGSTGPHGPLPPSRPLPAGGSSLAPLVVPAAIAVTVLVIVVAAMAFAFSRSGARTPSASPTDFGGGIVDEYKSVSFTLLGDDGENSDDSGVTFTAHGPEVITDQDNTWEADLLYRPDSSGGTLRFYDDVQAASAEGTPDGAACYTAIKRHPIKPEVRYADIHVGSAFCLLNSETEQLAHIRLTAKPSSNALTWSATGWQAADE